MRRHRQPRRRGEASRARRGKRPIETCVGLLRALRAPYANQTPALAVVLALIGDLIDKMQVDNTAAFKIDRGFESKIGFGVPKEPQIEAPKRQPRGGLICVAYFKILGAVRALRRRAVAPGAMLTERPSSRKAPVAEAENIPPPPRRGGRPSKPVDAAGLPQTSSAPSPTTWISMWRGRSKRRSANTEPSPKAASASDERIRATATVTAASARLSSARSRCCFASPPPKVRARLGS